MAFLCAAASATINLFPPGQNWNPGTDGAFNPTANVVVDLSQAPTGTWDQNNTPNTGKGVYDPTKWAVVFKYSSVNIPAGVTVTFTNHYSNAPVVWLVSGNVTINGTVDLHGAGAVGDGALHNAPPGAFRGGASQIGSTLSSAGFGPGGAHYGSNSAGYSKDSGGSMYGNAQILPLIGGSGGAGTSGAGSGGGAILIASGNTVLLNGAILAYTSYTNGSGGSVRIIADNISGTASGDINALGYGETDGRIRIEANSRPFAGSYTPVASQTTPSDPPIIWLPADGPTVKIVQIGSQAVPADPSAKFSFPDQDVSLASAAPMTVRLEAYNVPSTWIMDLRLIPRYGADSVLHPLKVSGDDTHSFWECQITAPNGFATLQGRAYKP